MTFRPERPAITAIAALVVFAVNACGSGGDGPAVAAIGSSSASPGASASGGTADRETTMRKFAQCMRRNGVPDFPDPTVDDKGDPTLNLGQTLKDKADDPSTKKALEACKQLRDQLRNGDDDPGDSQKRQDMLLKYAQCMRQNGMPDFPDPASTDQAGQSEFPGVDRNDPAYKKADAICRPKTLGTITAD